LFQKVLKRPYQVSLRNVSLGGPQIPFLGLIKRCYHGWLSVMTSSDVPLTSLPRTSQPYVHHFSSVGWSRSWP